MASSSGLRAGRATIELSLLAGPVQKQLKALEARTRSIGAGFAKIGAPLVGIGTAISGAFVAAARHFSVSGDELSKLSDRTNLSVESLSELRYAASQSGVSMGALSKGLRELQSKGVDPKSFDSILDSIAAIPDPLKQAQQAMQIFGKRTGSELLPMLGDLTELRQRARDLGLTMSTEDASAATLLGDRYDDLKQQAGALANVIGASVAGSFTKMMESALALGATLIDFMNRNRQLISTIFKVGAGIGLLGGALVSIGLTFTVISVAIGGFTAAIGVVATVLGAILSPLGLTIAALTGLTAWFATSTESGRAMVNQLSQYFARLAETAKQTFGGIADALSAGDIQLAAKILWSGLRLIWLQGTESIRKLWRDFTDVGAKMFIELEAKLKSIWTRAINSLKLVWSEFTGFWINQIDKLITMLAKVGETEGVKKQLDKALAERIAERRMATNVQQDVGFAERDRALAEIEAARQGAQNIRSEQFNSEVAAASKEMTDLQAELKRLTGSAQLAADLMIKEEPFAKRAMQIPKGALDAIGAKVAGMKAEAFLDPRMIQQFVGAGLDREQLDELRSIDSGIKRLASQRGGITFN